VAVATDPNDIPSGRFDCIVTDLLGVSVYSFEDARDWLLRLGDRFPSTSMVVMTAHGEAPEDARRLGVRVLAKPFDLDDLIAAVRDATRGDARDHIRKTP
jgi:DNA-binding NtrC family response regulator